MPGDHNRQLPIFKIRLVQRMEQISSARAKPSSKESLHWPLHHSSEVTGRTETIQNEGEQTLYCGGGGQHRLWENNIPGPFLQVLGRSEGHYEQEEKEKD